MLTDPPERFEGSVPVAAGCTVLVLPISVGQGVVPVCVVGLVLFIESLEPVLPWVV